MKHLDLAYSSGWIRFSTAALSGLCLASTIACSGASCDETRSCSRAGDGDRTSATGAAAAVAPSGSSSAASTGGAPNAAGGSASGNPGSDAGPGETTAPPSTGGSPADVDGTVPETSPPDGGAPDAAPSAHACSAGFADCNRNSMDGCEADLGENPDHCGSCDVTCSAAGTVGRACVSGACAEPSCDSTHLDCNSSGVDGCEIDKTDPDHCGTCAHVCGKSGVSARACANGLCKPTCDATHMDCNGDGTDGCETDVTTSTNCGACGHDCAGGQCENGVCQRAVLIDGLDTPTRLVVDSKYVHWIEAPGSSPTSVARAPITGTATRTALFNSNSQTINLKTDGKFIYWAGRSTAGSGSSANGFVMRFASGTTNVEPIASGVDPMALAVDTENTYFVGSTDGTAGIVYQAPSDGSTAPVAISGTLAVPLYMAVDTKNVFVAEIDKLDEVAIGGGGAFVQTQTTTPALVGGGVAVDAAHVYTSAYDSTKQSLVLVEMPKSLSGSPKELSTLDSEHPITFATDSKYVYFALPGGLYRVANTGGPAALLAPAAGDILTIVVSNGVVYWIDSGTSSKAGLISKLAVF